MGSGVWTSCSYDAYTSSTRGVDAVNFATSNYSTQEIFRSRQLDNVLNPYNVMRECLDSEEHPNTFPVILALDVTGSMGSSAVRVAQKLNEIMTSLYEDEDVKDVEFCVMGIGDLSYDDAPIQMSQFESDIRIAEQLDKIFFEAGGGGNTSESYTAAWYMGLRHCKLDCLGRGRKGLIITMGDEFPNPYLPKSALRSVVGDTLQADVETKDLLPEVREKFNVYHISVNDRSSTYSYYNSNNRLDSAWKELLGEDNYKVATLNDLAKIIVDIIKTHTEESVGFKVDLTNTSDEVKW